MAARALARSWRKGGLAWDFTAAMPDRPACPAALELLPANRMPKRGSGGSQRKSVALWHSLAHIEFVAIDLALDMAGRFGGEMGRPFVDDFLSVAADEAMHFALIDRKLRTLGSCYGALPVHDGLWEAAEATRHDVAARLAVGSAEALSWTKHTLNHWLRAAYPAFDASLAYEFLGFGLPDAREGLRSHQEKRPPSFGAPAGG